jgi:hypothetical protein
MNTQIEYHVKQLNNKFVVTKNNEPITLSSNSNQGIVTEFDSKEDAEKYLSILKTLAKKSK